jgi:PAS domain S-box-containing protein
MCPEPKTPVHSSGIHCPLNECRVLVLLFRTSGEIRDLSHSFVELLGGERSEWRGRNLFSILSETSDADLKQLFAEADAGSACPLDLEIKREGGERLLCRGQLTLPLSPEDPVCFTGAMLVENPSFSLDHRLITDAFMAAANAMVICDAKGRILKVNQAFTRFTGYTSNEAVGRSTALLKSGKHSKEFYEEMWATVLRGEVWQGEIINKRKNGTLYREEMTITPVFSAEGLVENFIAVKQDITERKQLEEMYFRSQRLECMGAIASGVAHDMNNVLSPIMMSADLLLAKEEDEERRELFQMIKDEAKQGAAIVKQLLGFARGDASEFTTLQLRHLLKDLVHIFRSTFPKRITIDAQLDRELNTVKGNTTTLNQVFTNLMINSRDAMPEGGVLLVEATNCTLDDAFCDQHSQARAGDFVRIRVQDDGIGMSAEIQEKIFDAFFTTKEAGKGTGLGLPTTIAIIKEHQGFLLVTSTPDVGTVMDVYLPGADLSEQEVTSPPHFKPITGDRERILVVDDEESVGYMLNSTLAGLGYTVEVLRGGQEAIDWIRTHPEDVDLLMLDMMMPEVDGEQVFNTLLEEGILPPTLIMSGMVPEDLFTSPEMDFSKNFIAKPFTIQDLSEKLHLILHESDG